MAKKSIQDLAEQYLKTKSSEDFTTLYKRLLPGLKVYIWSNYLKNMTNVTDKKAMMDDILQNVYLKTITKIDQYNNAWYFSSWVYRIARNETLGTIKAWSKNSKRCERMDLFLNEISEDSHKISTSSTNKKYENNYYMEIEDFEKEQRQEELLDEIIGKLKTLPGIYKDILIDRELSGLTYEELAEKYVLPIQTIKNRIHHGRLKVKQRAQSLYNEYKQL
jgi:RNA polymerase sigma factor (sigma-70 family)